MTIEQYENIIQKATCNISKEMYRIAHTLNEVRESGILEDSQYNGSLVDWAKDKFDYSKTFTYDLARVGRSYTIKSKNKYTSIFSEMYPEGTDFTVSQLIPLLQLGDDEVHRLVDENQVNPDMTCTEIRAFVKEYKSRLAIADDSVQPENESIEDSAQPENESIEDSAQPENESIEDSVRKEFDEARDALSHTDYYDESKITESVSLVMLNSRKEGVLILSDIEVSEIEQLIEKYFGEE